jgi:hypothetical protein
MTAILPTIKSPLTPTITNYKHRINTSISININIVSDTGINSISSAHRLTHQQRKQGLRPMKNTMIPKSNQYQPQQTLDAEHNPHPSANRHHWSPTLRKKNAAICKPVCRHRRHHSPLYHHIPNVPRSIIYRNSNGDNNISNISNNPAHLCLHCSMTLGLEDHQFSRLLLQLRPRSKQHLIQALPIIAPYNPHQHPSSQCQQQQAASPPYQNDFVVSSRVGEISSTTHLLPNVQLFNDLPHLSLVHPLWYLLGQ